MIKRETTPQPVTPEANPQPGQLPLLIPTRISHKFNMLIMDTSSIWIFSMAPSMSRITGFDCTGFTTTATTTTRTIFIVPKAEYYSCLQVVKLIN